PLATGAWCQADSESEREEVNECDVQQAIEERNTTIHYGTRRVRCKAARPSADSIAAMTSAEIPMVASRKSREGGYFRTLKKDSSVRHRFACAVHGFGSP